MNDQIRRPTWAVALWLSNDPHAREYAREGVQKMREHVEELVELGEAGLRSDLLMWALAYVDWEEVAKALSGGGMSAHDIMRQLDAEAGIAPRSNEELDMDIPASGKISILGYEEFCRLLESGDAQAILIARRAWGLSPCGG